MVEMSGIGNYRKSGSGMHCLIADDVKIRRCPAGLGKEREGSIEIAQQKRWRFGMFLPDGFQHPVGFHSALISQFIYGNGLACSGKEGIAIGMFGSVRPMGIGNDEFVRRIC